jgi:hypothetical protein
MLSAPLCRAGPHWSHTRHRLPQPLETYSEFGDYGHLTFRQYTLIVFPILVLSVWGCCQCVKLFTERNRNAGLRVLVPVIGLMLGMLLLLNQWFFWQPRRDKILNETNVNNMASSDALLQVWAKALAAELAW